MTCVRISHILLLQSTSTKLVNVLLRFFKKHLEKQLVTSKMSKNILNQHLIFKNFDLLITKLMFYFFKIFGIATVACDHVWYDGKKSWILVFKHSLIGIIYNVVSICLIIPLNIIGIIFVYKSKIFVASDNEISVITAFECLFSFGNVFTLVVFIFQQNKMASIGNKIYKMKELVPVEHKITNNKLCLFLFGNFVMSFGLIIFLSSFSEKISLAYTIIHEVNIFMVLFLLIQYSSILNMIKSFFTSINDALSEAFLKPHISTLEKLHLNYKLDKLMYSYTCLCDVSQDISNFYSLPMIWTVSNIFILLLFFLHIAFKRLFILKDYLDFSFVVELIYVYSGIVSLTSLLVYVTNTIEEVL